MKGNIINEQSVERCTRQSIASDVNYLSDAFKMKPTRHGESELQN